MWYNVYILWFILKIVSIKLMSLLLHCFISQATPIILLYEGESIKKQPNLFLGEIDLFFFDVIAL